jgi:hypothetical protein
MNKFSNNKKLASYFYLDGWLLKDGNFLNNQFGEGHWETARKHIMFNFPLEKSKEVRKTNTEYQFMFSIEAIRVVSGFSFEFSKEFLSESTLNRIKEFVDKNNVVSSFLYIDVGGNDIKIPTEEIENNGIWNAYIKERRMNRASSKLINILKISNINRIKNIFHFPANQRAAILNFSFIFLLINFPIYI